MTLTSLDDIFRLQDASAQQNRSELPTEFSLLEEALLLMAELIEFLKFDPSVARQIQQPGKRSNARNCQLNLAQASWASAVNVCRLLAFGAFTDMFSLYRGAVESYSFFWYLGRVPSDVNRWIRTFEEDDNEPKVVLELAIEKSSSLNSFRQRVKCKFEDEKEKGEGRKDLFKMLSTIGTHTNPITMFGSIPSQTHQNNLGFSSQGNAEYLKYGTYYSLILLKSYLEEIDLAFGRYVPMEHELRNRYVQLQGEFEELFSDDWVLRLPLGRTSI